MTHFLITMGSYSDYRVINMVLGPDDADLHALLGTFESIWDHGWSDSYEICIEQQKHATRSHSLEDPAWKAHGERVAPINAWRKAQPWYKSEDGEMLETELPCFVRWLVLEHGFHTLAYREVNLSD